MFNYIKAYFKRVKEDFKARLRGELPKKNVSRGRVYDKKITGYEKPVKPMSVKAEPTITLDMIVTRADGTKEYINGKQAKIKEIDNG